RHASPVHPLPSVSSHFRHPPASRLRPLSLHDALPILFDPARARRRGVYRDTVTVQVESGPVPLVEFEHAYEHRRNPLAVCDPIRSEEHTSELQSRFDLVCRLLLEKKNTRPLTPYTTAA